MLESRDYNINQYLRTEINRNNYSIDNLENIYHFSKKKNMNLFLKNTSLNYIYLNHLNYHLSFNRGTIDETFSDFRYLIENQNVLLP